MANNRIGYMATPQEAITQNNIDKATANYETMNDPLIKLLRGLTPLVAGMENMGKEVGMGMLTGGGSTAFGGGGTIRNKNVEVEGGETAELPNGKVIKFKGASHENGGINLGLPIGTDIFSNRISIDGVSLADRKAKRAKTEAKYGKRLENNPYDTISKNTLEKTKLNNTEEDKLELLLQTFLAPKFDNKKYGGGGSVFEELQAEQAINTQYTTANNPYTNINKMSYRTGLGNGIPTIENRNAVLPNVDSYPDTNTGLEGVLGSFLQNPNATLGNLTSLYGNYMAMTDPLKNTEKMRSGDQPNVNYFQDYGREGLKTIDDSAQYLEQQRANNLNKIQENAAAFRERNRNSQRGVSSMVAGDAASQIQIDKATGDSYSQFADKMMGLMLKKAGLQFEQDKVVMGGEQARDAADRADRDAYYSVLAQNYSTRATGMQQTGKDLNVMSSNAYIDRIIKSMSKYK